MLLRGAQYGLGFISSVIIARALGPDGRSAYALALNLSVIVFVTVHLSVELSAARLVARREATFRQLSQVMVTWTIVLGALGMGIVVAVGLPLREQFLAEATATSVLLAAATVPVTIAGTVTSALLLRRGVVIAYGWVQATQALLQLGLLAAAHLADHLDPEMTLAVNLVVTTASTGALMALLRRTLGAGCLRPSADRGLLLKVVRLGLAFHASSVALFLNLRVDLLIVGAMLDARRAGIYSLAVTLAELGAVAAATLSLAALKDQTELEERDVVDYTAAFARRTVRLAVLYALVASACSYPFIRVAYGAEWTDAVLPFVILSFAAVGLAIEEPARGLLLRIGRPRTVSAAAVVGLAVNLVVCLVLVDPLGLAGAALASMASYWVIAALMVMLTRNAARGLSPPPPPTGSAG